MFHRCSLCGVSTDSSRLVVRNEYDDIRLVIATPANDCDTAMDRVYALLDKDPTLRHRVECRVCSTAIAREQALEASYVEEELRKRGIYWDQEDQD